MLAIGVPLAPVTWLFGPVATFNVASTLAPVLSALAAFWLHPAVGALGPGRLPGRPAVRLLALRPAEPGLRPPDDGVTDLPARSSLGCLDELLVRQHHRPWTAGAALGLLLVVEFFVSTEVLVIVAMSSAVGDRPAGGGPVDRGPPGRGARLPHAVPGVGVAAVLTAAVLAYPAWYALAGPAHLAGRIWPNIPVIGGYTVRSFVNPAAANGTEPVARDRRVLRPHPALVLLPRMGAAGGGGRWGAGLAAGPPTVVLRLPWRWSLQCCHWASASTSGCPGSSSTVPRCSTTWSSNASWPSTYLALAVVLAMVLDRLRSIELPTTFAGARWTLRARRMLPLAAAAAVALAALVPIAAVMAPTLPYAVRPVDLPPWFAVAAPRLPPGQVLLVYPPPFSGIQSSMAWQAVNRMHYAQAGGGGPQGTPVRAGPERPGFLVLASLGFGFTRPPTGRPAQLRAVRQALRGWEVTMVVIPDQPGLPAILRGHDPEYAVAFMTAALGQAPHYELGAWVWRHVLSRPALPVAAGTLSLCTLSAEQHRHADDTVATCVQRAAAEVARRAHQPSSSTPSTAGGGAAPAGGTAATTTSNPGRSSATTPTTTTTGATNTAPAAYRAVGLTPSPP